MSRAASPAVLAQVAGAQLRPALFVEIDFLDDTVQIWGGLGPLKPTGPAYSAAATFPYGKTFTGVGWLGQIQAIPEVGDVVAENVTLQLSGIPTELITDAINAVRQNSLATIWQGFLDSNNNVLADPVQVFQGHLDVPTITEGADTCSIAITAENPLIDLNRAPEGRYTDIDQQLRYPGDTGFSQVQLLQDYNTVWPWPAPGGFTPAPPSYVRLGPSNPIVMKVGDTLQLTSILTRSDGSTRNSSTDAFYFTSDVGVATVTSDTGSAGLVTAIGPGMCVITQAWDQGSFTHSNLSQILTGSITIIVTE